MTPRIAKPGEEGVVDSPKGMTSPKKGRHLANIGVSAKHVTSEAIDKHEKREAMRREGMLESGNKNPHNRINPSPKETLSRREHDKKWEKYLQDNPDHPDNKN